MRRAWRKLLYRLRRAQLEAELAEELEFHRSQLDSGQGGLQMGNITRAKEESRDMWSFLRLERLWQDLRYAARLFGRTPGFTMVAVLSLALGIGGNASMFSLVNTLLVRPLPYHEPGRLLRMTGVYPRAALPVFQQQSSSMDVASASPGSACNLTGEGEAIRVVESNTSANFLSVLGAAVARGRAFEPGENTPGRDQVVILSNSLWKTKFRGDPAIVGRSIAVEGVNRQIVGVMPPAFSYPSARVQLWTPARLDPSKMEEYWGGEYVPLIARLRPGATLAQARGEIPALAGQVRRLFPFPMARDWNAAATAISMQQDLTGDIRGRLIILLSSVGLVLLIACANVANLLLSRATTRRKEIALRTALGADRFRIVRQLMTESILLACMGAGSGLLLGRAALSMFKSMLPPSTPGLSSVEIDWPVVVFVAILALLTGVAFGIAPALSVAQVDLTESIKTGSQRSTAGVWTAVRSWLIAGEVALTLILVISAGLLMKSLLRLAEANPGFDPAHVFSVQISPNQAACSERAGCIALYDRIIAEARRIAGVSEVSVVNTLPLDGELPAIPVDVEGHPKSADYPAPMLWAGAVSPGYLRMMHIPLLEGRQFTEADSAQAAKVLIITRATARHFWPGQSPIGKHIKSAAEAQWRTVIGVAGDVRQFSLAANLPDFVGGAIYMPYAQSTVGARQGVEQIPAAMHLLVKARTDSPRLRGEIRSLAGDQAPNAPVGEVRPLEEVIAVSVGDFQSMIRVFTGFAATAILLAAIGIYGLVSYWVTQRSYEIGVRMAIGATRQRIVSMVFAQSLRVALFGIGAGVLGALACTRFLASLLYGVSTTDPVIFAAVMALLLGIAVSATAVPAWKAARINPIQSLRAD
ncbi:MAG TPA: ABC transporter permease [Bryobacteraceae bacterium]|nr:ABC transporter permease [Bryobacteraceae bacterium]